MATRVPYEWLDHGNFSGGMVQDIPRHMLPDNAVWDALDCFVSEEGTLHKRGATTTCLSSSSAISASVIGVAQSDMETALLKGYIIDESPGAASLALLGAFTPGSGTFAVTSSNAPLLVSVNGVGRPFQHGAYCIFPFRAPTVGSASNYRMFGAAAGSINSSYSSTSGLTITAGTRAITGFSAPDIAAITAGDIIYLPKNTGLNVYLGRVTRTAVGTVYVSPTPAQSFTSTAGTWFIQTMLQFLDTAGGGAGTSSWRGAQGGASWQNRLIFGGVTRELQAAVYEHLQNRIIWSILPTEASSILAGADGDLFLSHYGYPSNNYADVPWMNKVMGLEPVSDGELFITGRPLCSRLVGTLNTNTTTSGGLTYELRPLNQRIPCIDDRATVRTPQGVMMMGPDGIYLYREGNLINTMIGRIQNYYLANIANATIYGAGVLPSNHYYLSTSAGTLLCNMDGFRWTRWSTNTQITNCFNDPADTTRVFTARYQPGTSSNTTKLLRADYLVNPSATAKTDVSGTGPTATIKTKTYIDGDASRLKQFRHEKVTIRMPSVAVSGTVTISSTPGLDGEETGATLGTLSSGAAAQTARYDTTTISKAYGLTIAQTGNPDEFELVDIDVAPRPLNPKRIT